MEKGKKEVLEFLSIVFNVDFGEKNIGDLIWEAEHYYEVKASREYNHFSVIDFLTLYQIDCLYEKGLIVEKDRNNLIRLFYQKKDLFNRIGKRESDDEMLSGRIDQIDKIFAKYNIGEVSLETLFYNNAKVNEKVDLDQEMKKIK